MFENIVNDVAGLLQSAGRLTVEREVAGSIPAKKRRIYFFFQSYPHYTHHTISPPMVKRFPESFVRHVKLHFHRIPRVVLVRCCNRVNH